MSGQTSEEYCKNAIEAEVYIDLDAPEFFGKLLCDGWRESIDGKANQDDKDADGDRKRKRL